MKYQVTFTAMWNTIIEADSREEANEILERDWERKSMDVSKITQTHKMTKIDSSFMNLEADLEEEGYDDEE